MKTRLRSHPHAVTRQTTGPGPVNFGESESPDSNFRRPVNSHASAPEAHARALTARARARAHATASGGCHPRSLAYGRIRRRKSSGGRRGGRGGGGKQSFLGSRAFPPAAKKTYFSKKVGSKAGCRRGLQAGRPFSAVPGVFPGHGRSREVTVNTSGYVEVAARRRSVTDSRRCEPNRRAPHRRRGDARPGDSAWPLQRGPPSCSGLGSAACQRNPGRVRYPT